MSNTLSQLNNAFNTKAQAGLIRSYLQLRKVKNNITLNYFPERANLMPGSPSPVLTTRKNKIEELEDYIDRDYCFLDLPEHGNIGDHMISRGSLEFLNTLPFKNRYQASIKSFEDSQVDRNDLIILHGGGNFGDLWSVHQHFREHIISSFKNNKIIIFPQTIFFQQNENLRKAITIFSSHPDLTICTRDHRSFEIAKNTFTKNTILLLPDMASYISLGFIKQKKDALADVLFMQRHDKELKERLDLSFIRHLEVKDWPTYEHNYFTHLPSKHKEHRFYLNEGLIFMAQYDLVISTRLHGFILAALLGIPAILVDNSYGKNSTYFETWLKDMPHGYLACNKKQLRTILENHFSEVIP